MSKNRSGASVRPRRLKLPAAAIQLKRHLLFIAGQPANYIYWLILVTVLIGLYLLIWNPGLKITALSCQMTNGETCPAIVIAELSQAQNQPIFLTDTDIIRQKIISTVPSVKRVEVHTRLPNQIDVTLYPAEIFASLRSENSLNALLVTSDLRVVETASDSLADKPVIITANASELSLGDYVDAQALLFTRDLIMHLQSQYLSPTRLSIMNEEEIVVNFKEGFTGVFSPNLDVTRQVTTLQLILSEVTINQSIPIIDVRFQNPVLKPAR
jgi:cell division septal protein FtsQ